MLISVASQAWWPTLTKEMIERLEALGYSENGMPSKKRTAKVCFDLQ